MNLTSVNLIVMIQTPPTPATTPVCNNDMPSSDLCFPRLKLAVFHLITLAWESVLVSITSKLGVPEWPRTTSTATSTTNTSMMESGDYHDHRVRDIGYGSPSP